MKIVNVKNIDVFDQGYSWNFGSSNKESERLSNILDYIKKISLINSLKEFAEDIGENSVGMNDLRKGRKKISIKHIKNMNKSYPYINTDYILLGEELPFINDFLIKKVSGERYSVELDIVKIKNFSNIINLSKNDNIETPKKKDSDYIKLYQELVLTKNELLDAKNKIISLKDIVHELKLLNSKKREPKR